MPAQPSWHVRVPEILAALSVPDSPPILDRSAFERLFQVRRRQAIRLISQCDGYQVGKTFLAGRENVISFLKTVKQSGQVDAARGHRVRLGAVLNAAANQRTAEQTRIVPQRRSDSSLHPAIHFPAPGKLEISFDDATGLLTRLVELATFAANDFTRFQQVVEGGE